MFVPSRSGRRRLLPRRLPPTTAYSVVELALIVLVAVQAARLIYALITPVGPIGAWQFPSAAAPAPVSANGLASFDPFFRLSSEGGATVVTSLDLQLFGVREDRATGRGSAIIATPDGNQQSFTVGDEIMPGVTLTAVGFDSVTLSRGGAEEQIFLDQSTPVEPADVPQTSPQREMSAPAPAAQPPAPAPAVPGVQSENIQ